MIEKLDQLTKTASVILLFSIKETAGRKPLGFLSAVCSLPAAALFVYNISFSAPTLEHGQSYCRYKRNYSAIRSQTAVEKATGSSIGSPSMRSAWL